MKKFNLVNMHGCYRTIGTSKYSRPTETCREVVTLPEYLIAQMEMVLPGVDIIAWLETIFPEVDIIVRPGTAEDVAESIVMHQEIARQISLIRPCAP